MLRPEQIAELHITKQENALLKAELQSARAEIETLRRELAIATGQHVAA